MDIRIGIQSIEQFKSAFGIDIEKIKGMELLNDTEKEHVIRGIFSLVNNVGLDCKHEFVTYKVEKSKNGKYKLYTKRGYSYLYPGGSIG